MKNNGTPKNLLQALVWSSCEVTKDNFETETNPQVLAVKDFIRQKFNAAYLMADDKELLGLQKLYKMLME